MGALDDAQAHLSKSREFLDAAENDLVAERYNAATSSAVTSGINAKDAICLKLTGRTNKSDNHTTAVAELERSGKVGKDAAADLRRLLGLKSKSQYQKVGIAKKQAEDAVKWADRMYRQARLVLSD